MIRLGIRVRAEDAEIAFARLEPVLAAGAEEIDHFEDDAVEFAVYGDSLPSDEALKALAGDTEFEAPVRIDTPKEAEYRRHGGILQFVLRSLAAS